MSGLFSSLKGFPASGLNPECWASDIFLDGLRSCSPIPNLSALSSAYQTFSIYTSALLLQSFAPSPRRPHVLPILSQSPSGIWRAVVDVKVAGCQDSGCLGCPCADAVPNAAAAPVIYWPGMSVSVQGDVVLGSGYPGPTCPCARARPSRISQWSWTNYSIRLGIVSGFGISTFWAQ